MWANIKYWFKHHDYAWKYKLEVCLPLFVFLIIFDWATKIAVQYTMTQNQAPINVMPGFMQVGYIINPGSAYGANAGSVGGSIAIAAVITLITGVIIALLNDKMWLIAIVFIFSGSFANLIGRAWSPAVADELNYAGTKGGVIDFMQWGFHTFNADSYIFNVADLEVNIGVILLIVFVIVEIIKFIVSTNRQKQVTSSRKIGTANKAENDPEEWSTNQPRVDEVRQEYDEPASNKLSEKELKAQGKLDRMLGNKTSDRDVKVSTTNDGTISIPKANSNASVEEINARTRAIEERIKQIKAQMKLEKMTSHEHKSN